LSKLKVNNQTIQYKTTNQNISFFVNYTKYIFANIYLLLLINLNLYLNNTFIIPHS